MVRGRVAGRGPRVAAARRRTCARTVVDRAGGALRRAGVPRRPRRAILRPFISDDGNWFGVTITAAGLLVIGLTAGGATRPQRSSLAALIAVEGRDRRDRRRAAGDLSPPPASPMS